IADNVLVFVQWIGLYYSVVKAILFFVVGVGLAIFVYLRVPQELGGVRPRCAYLDIDSKMTSTEIRAVILAAQTKPENQVVRSVQLDVLFSGSDTILVRPREGKKTPSASVYEISRRIVQTITWCN